MNYCPSFPLVVQRPRFRGDALQLDGFHEGLHVRLSCPGSALEAFWLHWDDALGAAGVGARPALAQDDDVAVA